MLVAVHPVPATDIQLKQAFASGGGNVRVGRVQGNEVSATILNGAAPREKQVQDRLINMMSRQHARLEVVSGQLQLVDLGAVNGSYVNDHRLQQGSKRVLLENDVVSFGGPIHVAVKGQGALNPWVWRVKHLHEFLASFVPPNQAPPASSVLAMRTATPTGHNTAREVYSFSPASAPPRQPGQALSQAAPQVSGGQRPGYDETAASRDEVVSPEPSHLPAGVLHQPGTLPVQQHCAPKQDTLDDGSVESAELTALEAYEAGQWASVQQRRFSQPQAVPLHGAAGHAAAPGSELSKPPGAAPAAPTGHDHGGAPGATAPAHPVPSVDAPRAAVAPRRAALPGLVPPPDAAPPVTVDLIDLTADSPVTQHQHQPGARAAGRADFVDLLAATATSPSKRRHSTERRAEVPELIPKRAKASPETHLRPAPPAAEPATGPSQAEAEPARPVDTISEQLQQEMVCPICQELLAVSHAMVPCGHWFCGECLAQWLRNSRRDCPSCRKTSTAPPLRQHSFDNMVEAVAKSLPPDDLEARRVKLKQWEQRRAEFEEALAAPWQHRGAGQGEDPSAEGGLFSAIAASILGGAGGLGFGPGQLLVGGGPGMEVPPWGGGGARGRRGPAVVPRHSAGAEAPPPTEFRAELAQAACPCAACGQMVGHRTTRIGMRPRSRRGQPSWRWHHLGCVTAQQWREARGLGVGNLRNIPAAEQSRVRQYMSLAPP